MFGLVLVNFSEELFCYFVLTISIIVKNSHLFFSGQMTPSGLTLTQRYMTSDPAHVIILEIASGGMNCLD